MQNQLAAGVVASDPVALRGVETLDRRPATALQNALQTGLGSIGNNQAGGGQGADKVVKLRFDSTQIGEDVGVIEFQIVQNDGARPVMDEF